MACLAGGAQAADQGAGTHTLTGIIYRPDGPSSAVFNTPGGAQKLVSEGRCLDQGTDVLQITPERVQIRHNGQLKWLDLTESKPTGTTSAQAAAQQASSVQKAAIPQQAISSVRRRKIRLATALEPASNGARGIGLTVTSDTVFDLLHSAPLQVGDVITKINGQVFVNAEDIEDFAHEWRADRALRYRVIRNGQTLMLP
ncbi:MAG: hypothetical protein AAF862_01665 [Pseudomonadota bacterium]